VKVSEVMAAPAITVRASAPIEEAVRLLADNHVNTLPVTDREGRLVAMLTETDVLRALALRLGIGLSPTAQLDPGSMPRRVADIATAPRTSVRPTDDMSYCLALMVADGGRSIPVLGAGRVVGIISRLEALRALERIDLETVRNLIRAGRLPNVGEPAAPLEHRGAEGRSSGNVLDLSLPARLDRRDLMQ